MPCVATPTGLQPLALIPLKRASGLDNLRASQFIIDLIIFAIL